ncbi:complement receptor type 2-like isoform X2 [Rhipicephalus microplus]|uniref:complement receptor type 2-like isoform X2 n=1 Tax=Rhipicephalus microplus TaxID=6941 RepID=UPI003F6B70A8
MNGTWSGLEPHCQAAFPNTSCPQLGPIAHGDVTVEPGQIHVNTRAEYQCDIHYTLIGDKERFCQLNGMWSGKEPICHDANADTCPPPPPIPNGAMDVAPGPIVVRTRIEYRCHSGYALLGQSERFCQHNGSWTGAAPVCEANCPVPGPIANGDVSVPGSKLFPNIPVQYQCNVGYTLVGPQVRVCQADGTWSGSEPVCQSSTGPKNCPAPAPIVDGDVDVPPGPLVANTRVRYRCNVGYLLIGPSERSCKPDGSWTGTQPICQRLPHTPPGDDKTTQPDDTNTNEAKMTSWVLVALMGILVVAGAVALYMAYQFFLSREGGEDAAAIVANQDVETKSAPLP